MSQKLHSKLQNINNTYLKPYGINAFTFILAFTLIILYYKVKYLLPLINRFISKFEKFIDIFKEDNLINIITYIIMISIGIYFLYNRLNNRNTSINSLLIMLLIGSSVLLISSNYNLYPINFYITYSALLLSFISLYIIFFSIRLFQQIYISQIRTKQKENNKEKEEVGWKNYLENLSNIVLKHNTITDTSFALGIMGTWGSGKTTFLNALKIELENRAFLINFNPWNSHSDKQITNDFFNTLISELSPFYSGLNKPLKKYANILIQLDIDNKITRATKILLDNTDNSLDNLKSEVEQCLQHFEKPIVVFIDDLDRLNGDEILEVFKLVRNSAQFKNIIYIAAYDKNYINRILEKKGITTPDQFIEKLFYLEISLPTYESNVLPDILLKSLNQNELFLDKNQLDVLKNCIYTKDNGSNDFIDIYTISRYLPTFRAINRFSLQLQLNINSLKKNAIIDELNLSDLFWIELLHYTDLDLYRKIQLNPNEFLTIIDGYYILSDNRINELSGKSKILINLLFGKKTLVWNTVQRPEFFTRYFSYRLLTNQVSWEEFKSILKESDTSLDRFISKNYETKTISLIFMFSIIPISTITEINILDRIFKGLINLYKLSNHNKVIDVFKNILSHKNYQSFNEDDKTIISNNLKEAFEKHIETNYISSILTSLFGQYTNLYDPYINDTYLGRSEFLILTNQEIEDLACKSFSHQLKQKDFKAINFFISGKEEYNFLNRYIKTSKYNFPHREEIDEPDSIEKYLLCQKELYPLIETLSSSEILHLISNIFTYIEDEDDNYDFEGFQYKIYQIRIDIELYFKTISNYKDFIKEKNVLTEDEIKKYFKEIKIDE